MSEPVGVDMLRKPWPAHVDDFPCECPEGAGVGMRCSETWVRCNARLKAIYEWRVRQPDLPARPEAARR